MPSTTTARLHQLRLLMLERLAEIGSTDVLATLTVGDRVNNDTQRNCMRFLVARGWVSCTPLHRNRTRYAITADGRRHLGLSAPAQRPPHSAGGSGQIALRRCHDWRGRYQPELDMLRTPARPGAEAALEHPRREGHWRIWRDGRRQYDPVAAAAPAPRPAQP